MKRGLQRSQGRGLGDEGTGQLVLTSGIFKEMIRGSGGVGWGHPGSNHGLTFRGKTTLIQDWGWTGGANLVLSEV